jgi:serine protease AprX
MFFRHKPDMADDAWKTGVKGQVKSVYMKRQILAAILLTLAPAAAVFGRQKLAPELVNTPPGGNVRVVVSWRHIPDAADHAKVLQHGGELKGSYSHMKTAVYTIPAQSLQALSSDPDVAYIAPDRPVRSTLDYTAAAVNAPSVWARGFTGTGVTVAVIDSGMNPNPDLDPKRIVWSQDFTGQYAMKSNVADLANAPDTFGHGEHVTGIIAGSGKTSLCSSCTRVVAGIAASVKLVNLRALDDQGNGSDSTVIAAIDKAIELKSTLNIRVINLSLGRPVFESYTQDPLCQAVEQAWKAGIVVVVAAGNNGRDDTYGNNGYGTITAPGNDPYVITVGAMKTMQTYSRTDDLIASYSSKGPTAVDYVVKPDLVAPGNQVVSLQASKTATLVKNFPGNIPLQSYYMSTKSTNTAPAYFNLSGTSMATPVVSAAVADLLQAEPTLTPDQVKARLMLTAYKIFPTSSTATDPATGQSYVSYYDPFTVGAGYLDLAAALSSKAAAIGTALSPTAVYDSDTDSIYLVGDGSAVWAPVGSGASFAVNAIWPSSGIDAQSNMWGQRLAASSNMWGQRLSATSNMWGQRMALSLSTTKALSGGVSAADASVSAANAPSAQAATVAITGEQ